MVITDDPKKTSLSLTVAGLVEKFVTIIPKRVALRGFVGEQIKATAKIIPEEKYPFKIVGVEAFQAKNIDYKLEEAERSKGIEYVLAIENLKKDKGRYYDTIILKTDSKIKPEIKIRVIGNILDKPPEAKK